MKEYEELKIIYDDIKNIITGKTKDFLDIIKKNSATYEEVDKKIDQFIREMNWSADNNKNITSLIVLEVKKCLENEKGSLPLTNCPD